MVPLTEETWLRIRALFPTETQAQVAALLEENCADNLPFCQQTTPEQSERIRFAVLKLSQGDYDQLQKAVTRAKRDWRDTLMASGFGRDLTAHKHWTP